MTATTSQELLAAADRVRDAATEETVRNPAQKSEPHRASADAAARAAWLAAQQADVERSARTLADLPRRRGTSTGRPKR